MELKTIFLTTVYVILCIYFSLAQDEGSWTGKYKKEELADLNETISDIAVSPHTGNVYLACGAGSLYVIKTYSCPIEIDIQANIWAVAVDKLLKNVYIGCDKGIKIYDENTGSISKVPEVQTIIYRLFVPKNSNKIYGVTSPNNEVYVYQNSFTDKFNLNIEITNHWNCRFVVDLEGNFFYTTSENGRFVTKILSLGDNSPKIYKAGPFHSLSVDYSGRVYGTSFADNSVYRLKKDASTPNKVATLEFEPYAMSFDKNNNPVFATQNNKVILFEFPTTTC